MTLGDVGNRLATGPPPPTGFRMTATSAVIRAWWRGSDRTRRRGEWDISHLKGPPHLQLFPGLKGGC